MCLTSAMHPAGKTPLLMRRVADASEGTKKVDYSQERHLSSSDLWDLAGSISETIISHYYCYSEGFILKALRK